MEILMAGPQCCDLATELGKTMFPMVPLSWVWMPIGMLWLGSLCYDGLVMMEKNNCMVFTCMCL